MNNLDTLMEDLKKEIIEQLNLQHLSPADIDPDAPLIGAGLGLDSIDALEIIVLLEKKYGAKVSSPEEGRTLFKDLRTIATFVQSKQAS